MQNQGSNVGTIALGVALGLVIFCGGGFFLLSASCAATMSRAGERSKSDVATIEERIKASERERAREEARMPAVGKTGLAVPIEEFMAQEWKYTPDPADVQEGLLLSAPGGYSQTATFEFNGKKTAWEFTIRNDKVSAEEIK